MKNDKPLTLDQRLSQATCAILDNEGQAKATAWLVSDRGHLLTVAHAFEDHQNDIELSEHKKGERPVNVRFENDAHTKKAYILRLQRQKSAGIDIAVLELEEPPAGRTNLQISLQSELEEGRFVLRGYGENLPKSQVPGKGEILGEISRDYSPKNALLALQSKQLVHAGFSGGAVWSYDENAVVGIQIEKEKTAGTETVLAMPMYRIAEWWGSLSSLATHAIRGTCVIISSKQNDERFDQLVKEVIEPIVNQELGYEVKRSEYGVKNSDLENIEQAELVIADISSDSLEDIMSVVYEVTVAEGLGIPDLVICDESVKINLKRTPFNKITKISLDDFDKSRKNLKDDLDRFVKMAKMLHTDVSENKITSYFKAPLIEISPANGLALGYFRNFIEGVVLPLKAHRKRPTGNILVDGKVIENSNVTLNIIIPKSLEQSENIDTYLVSTHSVISATVIGSRRKYDMYALPAGGSEDNSVHLIDIPTAMNTMAEAINQRIGVKSVNEIEWQELEEKEIRRFTNSLWRNIRQLSDNSGLPKDLIIFRGWNDAFGP